MNNTANEPIEVRLHQILSVLRVQLKDALTPQTHDHESLEFFGDSVLRERVCRYIINSRYKHLDSRNFNLMIQSCICNKNLEMCFDVARIEELVYLPTNTIKKEMAKKSDLLQTNNTPINKRSKDYLAKQNNSSPSRFNKTVTLFPIKTKADVIEALIGKLSSLMFHKNEIQYSLFKHYRLALQLILRLCVQNGEQEFLKDNYHHYQKKKNQVQQVQQVQQNQQSFKKTKNNLNTNSINVSQPKNNNFKQNPNTNLNKKAIHKPTQKQKNKNSSSISSENPIQQRFSSKKNEKFKKYNKGFNTNKKKNFYNTNQIRLSNNKNKNKNNKNNNIKNNSNNNNNKNFNNNHNQKNIRKTTHFIKKNNTQQKEKEKEKEKDKNQSRDLNKKSDFLNQLIENNNSKREKIKKNLKI